MKKINCILLVDDNPADNEFHKIVIEKAAVCNHIKVTDSGPQAISYLLKSLETKENERKENFPMPDIIFVDINMPGMNGFDFLREYTKIHWKLPPGIELIMLTTSFNPDDRLSSVKAGNITGYLNKPLTVEAVQELVEKYF